jgi:PHD/YefM family antitoxin component YafN of YafNO toxin-antitoxin module
MDIRNILTRTVSISQLNKGKAGQIFDEVKKFGAKVVMKNNEPECVLISPEEYLDMVERLEDAELYMIASEREKNFDESKAISIEEVYKKFGITEEDLEGYEEVEFE